MSLRIVLKDGVLYEAQKSQGTSRDGLSRLMGVATSTAFKVERGDVDPSPKFIAAFMRVTGRAFEDLFDIVGEELPEAEVLGNRVEVPA